MKIKAPKRRKAAPKRKATSAPARSGNRTVVMAGHRAPRRRKVGKTSSNMEMLAFTVLGGVAAKVISKTVQNSTTLGLKPKTGGFDVTPYIAPAIGFAAYHFLKDAKFKAMGAGAVIVGVADAIPNTAIPQLLSGVPQVVGTSRRLPQTVGKQMLHLNGVNKPRNGVNPPRRMNTNRPVAVPFSVGSLYRTAGI